MKLSEALKDQKISHPKMPKNMYLKYYEGNPYDSPGWYIYKRTVNSDGETRLTNIGLAILSPSDINDTNWFIFKENDTK